MFNSSQKEAFISSLEGRPRASKAMALFNNTEPFEESKGKDLADFTRSELAILVGELISTTDSARKMGWNIKAYGQWVHNDSKWMSEFSVNDVDIPGAMRKFLLGGEDDVESILQLVDESWSMFVPAIILLWYGMSPEEIVSLKKERCIIQQDVAVFSSGKRTIVINNPSFVSRLYTYNSFSQIDIRRGHGFATAFYIPSDCFIRVYAFTSLIDSGKAKLIADTKQISNTIFAFAKKNDLEISPTSILTSGRLYRLATTYSDATQHRKAVSDEFEIESRNIADYISDVENYRMAFLK